MLTTDPLLPVLVGISLIVILVGFLSKRFKQPYVVSYIIAGLILGEYGLGVLKDEVLIASLGSIGVTLLLFFIGMEIDIKKLISNWKVAVIGTICQILISVFAIWIFGNFLGWDYPRIILMGFVVSLSSTAVVLKVLEEWNETNTKAGQNVISVLISQDFAVIPMLFIVGLLSNKGHLDYGEISLQLIGMVLMLGSLIYIIRKKEISIPFVSKFKDDHEMQVFFALFICFGVAFLSGMFNLSTALGAFLAGIFISASKDTEWIHDALGSFRIFFVSLFFISIGLLIDISFLIQNIMIIIVLVAIVYVTNTCINAIILMFLKNSWRDSLYAGSMLSQIGEFSFLLIAVGFEAGIIANFGYQMTIQVIAITLLLSPLWINFMKRIICHIDHFSQKLQDIIN